MAQRGEAAAQFAVASAMTLGFYPALTAGYRAVTGEKNAEIEPRGMSRLAQTGIDVARGKTDIATGLNQAYTPSIVATGLDQARRNQDFRGKPIIDQQNLTKPKNLLKAGMQGADWAARTAVPPYGQITQTAHQPGATTLGTAGKFVGSQLGINDKSDAAVKREATIAKIQAATARGRERSDTGVGGAVNRWLGR
jgi:hypothetical protein